MALTDREIRKIEHGKTLVKMSDGGGLQLWVMPDGAKRWRLAYRYNGKQKNLAIGVYPTTSLRQARDARDDARRLLGSGQDPSLVRKLDKAAKAKASANTFNSLADELLEKKRADFWDERVRMMTWWADRCREMQAGGTVVSLRA